MIYQKKEMYEIYIHTRDVDFITTTFAIFTLDWTVFPLNYHLILKNCKFLINTKTISFNKLDSIRKIFN